MDEQERQGANAIDVLEWQLPREVLEALLKDHTTGRNIVWGSKDYERQFGAEKGFGEWDEIKAEQLIDRDRPVIRPRIVKARAEQRQRSVEKAEVFTPAWVCNQQNNLVDAAWFGRKTSPFNAETFDKKTGLRGWKTNPDKIAFPKGKTWLDYVFARRLEISCGEAPYLTSRYDAVSGAAIPPENRIGLLDRKLRIVGENFIAWGPERWFEGAKWAVQSVYGYDWQGDNVLLARENLLFAVREAFEADFGVSGVLSTKGLVELAEIISWNVWQMDGIKFVVPASCGRQRDMLGNPIPCLGCQRHDVWSHDGTRCRVMDWTTGKAEDFLPERRRAP